MPSWVSCIMSSMRLNNKLDELGKLYAELGKLHAGFDELYKLNS